MAPFTFSGASVLTSKNPSSEVRHLGDGRWALMRNGVARHVSRDPEECAARGRLFEAAERGGDLEAQGRALHRAVKVER